MPADAADENARVGGEQERNLDRVEERGHRAADRVVDHVTPSSTAWSMAATCRRWSSRRRADLSQQTLYIERRARGAMPLTLPREAASPVAWTPLLPPASRPCGCRGRRSRAARGTRRRGSTEARVVEPRGDHLVIAGLAGKSSPAWQILRETVPWRYTLPFEPRPCGPRSGVLGPVRRRRRR